MTVEAHIVRAVFLSDPRGVEKGKQYHYRVPGAKVGDIITGPGATGPAEVVGLGRRNWKGPVKDGSFWLTHTDKTASLAGVLKSVYTSDNLERALYSGAEAFIPIHAGKEKTMAYNQNMTPTEQAAELEAEAKRIRKADKKAKRVAQEKARIRKLRDQRREDATAALHSLALYSKNDGARIEAAKALLDLS
jgi:hypothetical protein